MTDLIGLPPLSIGAGGLVTLIVLLLLTGKLPTLRELRDAQADRDKWRESAERWQQTALQLGMSMEKLLVYAETTNHALTEIQELAARAAEQEAQR